MTSKKAKTAAQSYLVITLSCIVYAIGFDQFYMPCNFSFGGFSGISQIINFFLPFLPVGAMIIVLNVPLFWIGLRRYGFSFIAKSLYTMALSSLLIDCFAALFTFAELPQWVSCLCGGLVMGTATGFLMNESATTGGTELAAWIVKDKAPGISLGKICLVIDVTIIVIYAGVFRSWQNALYGCAAMYIATKMLDVVVYGPRQALHLKSHKN